MYVEEGSNMKLGNRSGSYEREPLTLEVTEGEIVGKYRGRTWQYHQISLGMNKRCISVIRETL